MNASPANQRNKEPLSSSALKITVLVLTCLAVFGCMVLPDYLANKIQSLAAGEVASQEILAPYSLTFESKVLTEKARNQAAAAVNEIYLPSDPEITKAQLESLNNALYFINTVRQDKFSTDAQKISDLYAIAVLDLNDEESQELLSLSDESWTAIQKETNRVLEQVLRESIRNEQVKNARANLPAIVDFSFPSDETKLIIALVSPLVVPTSLYSAEQTDLAREQARAQVEPISRQIIAGEVIVRRGQVVDDEDLEALKVFGLAEPVDQNSQVLKSGALVILCGVITGLYYHKRRNQPFTALKSSVMIALFFVLFLGLARFLVIDRTVLPYLYPMAAFGLTIAIIFNMELGIFLSLLLGVLTVFGTGREAELASFYILPVITGMLTIRYARRISSFLVAGLFVALAGMAIVVVYRFADTYTDWLGFSSLLAAAAFNGFASGSLTLLLQHVFASVLDIPTALQLLDIARPDHPLLQLILRNAPGSYQHSLLVSNLAEQAAEAIGADRLLVRVGTLFHDAGKSANPEFFIENQVKDKIDAHDGSDPALSAATIIQHVINGVTLAKKYRLPSRVIDFIREHHGTMVTRYQYSQALNAAERPEDVDLSLFTYPGPAPRSKETALLMLADGTEARARANTPKTDEEIRAVIQSTIDACKDAGQLDDTDLTLKDLKTIAESFFETLQRSYHPRIQYPALKPAKNAESAAQVENKLPQNATKE